jgi:hypothetical protein
LEVTRDGHYLQFQDGAPFFWLGDTGWELFHRLTLDEIKTYLDNRSAKGFNVIQAVALAEFDGLRVPNRYGELPFRNLDPDQPNVAYFSVIDSTIKMAAQRGMYIGLLPTWGDKVTLAWGAGPVIFDSVNAYRYGRWLSTRYKNSPNIIWILGGDRPALTEKDDWTPVWRQMAKGIIDGTGHHCLIAYHPSGGNSTSRWLQQERWLDVNMFQSGHGGGHDVPCWEMVSKDRNMLPVKPTLDAEPNYEDHPVNPWPKWVTDSGYYRAYDVRRQTYRSVFAGACGVTYGHHAIWQFMGDRQEAINYPDRGWVNAMDRPGAYQAGYLRRLMESRPLLSRQPDSSLIPGQVGKGKMHMEAFTGDNGHFMMLYMPVGRKLTISTHALKAGSLNGWWFDPKNASVTKAILTPVSKDQLNVEPPALGDGNDWVLVIDDAERRYGPLAGATIQ